MRKRLHTLLLLMIAMLVQSIAIPVQAQEWVGSGTTDEPYQVSSKEHLAAIPTQGLSHCYKLTTPITVDGWNTGIDKFAGTFDGGGFVITLTGSTSLFGTIAEGGTVKKLGLNATINSITGEYVGGIAIINQGTIQRCYVEGTITRTGSNSGGIAGQNEGIIQDCYSTASVTATAYYAGGIAGQNYKGTIQRCYATGAISSKSSGGIVGTGNSTNTIQNCIALNQSIAKVTGGLAPLRIASPASDSNQAFANNYASPAIDGTWNNKGLNQKDGADLDATNFTNVKEASGAFTDWPMGDDGWDLATANLPTLKGFKAAQPVAGITRKSVMLLTSIASATDLAAFRDAVNGGETYTGKTVTLTANITVDAWTTGIDGFTGTFDGGGYVITMTNATTSLFKEIKAGGTVKNLGVNATITITSNGNSYGGIAMTNKGTIQQCYAEGSITGTNTWGGGIVGTNEGAIRDCYSTASITVNAGAGGIAQVNNGTIERCYATGAIGKSGSTGGIAGDNKSSITNCIALNTSIGGTDLGRIVGPSTGTLTGNYASPAIPGTWSNKGADKIDGADLDDDTFTGKGANEGAFTGWLATAWDFGDNTKLPTLTGFKAAQSVATTTRASVMPKPLITKITSEADLIAFRDTVKGGATYTGKTVTLAANITVNGWAESINSFDATFNGDGYVITMTNATASLFNTIKAGGTVKNLGVNATISAGSKKVGGIATMNRGTIQRCYVEGTITSTAGYIGGIADNEGIIEDCYSTVSITVTTGFYTGGIAGGNYNGTILRCYATGAISSPGNAGIAGAGVSTNSIQDCIALNESITGTGASARVANGSGTFTNNYASPAIPGTWSNIGADKKDGADLTDATFIGTGAGEGAFTNWSETAWDFGDNTKLPTLTGFKGIQPVASITRKSKIPAITSIATAADLIKFRDAVNGDEETYKGKTVTLTADITVSDWSEPIGVGSCFKGTFEGQGHVITLTGSTCLFGEIGESEDKVGTVQNLGVKVTLTEEQGLGAAGIVDTNYGTIQNCYTEGTISNANWGGGIAVFNYNLIQDCYSTASIIESNDGGGIVYANYGTIQRCYATGVVKSGNSAGGIAGMNAVRSKVESCIALNTNIEGSSFGRIAGLSAGTFATNYASPLIPGTWNNIDATKIDGADLTEDNFIDTGAGASAFDGWLPAIWDFSDADKLPKLKTTGLATDIVIAGQGILPDRSDFLNTDIKISTAVAYDAATHKGKSILVESTGTFTVDAADASLKKLTLEEGGQVVASKAFKCSQLLAPRTLGNRWTAYSSPVEMKAVAKEKIQFYTRTGYATAEDQGWDDLYLPSTATSCLLTSPTLVAVEGADIAVTLTSTAEESTPLTIPADVKAPIGSALSTGIFVFCQNPTLKNDTIPVAYILSADGKRFERTSGAIVKPFQSYMVANAATSAAVLSLRAGGVPTANEPIATSDFRIWGSKGQLHVSAQQASKVAIYDLSGRLIHRFTLTGERCLTLRSGIYLVQSNNITYKISL